VKKLLDDLKDKKKIVSLSTKYGVLHKSTAFVAVGPMLKDPMSGDVKLEKVSITRSSPSSGYSGFRGGSLMVGFGQPCHYTPPSYYDCGCVDLDDDYEDEDEDDLCLYEDLTEEAKCEESSSSDESSNCYSDLFGSCACPPPFAPMREMAIEPVTMRYSAAPRRTEKRERSAPSHSRKECKKKKTKSCAKSTLDQVVMCQKANGSFTLDVLDEISLSEDRVRSILPPHEGMDDENAMFIWVTIIVLKHLEIKESARKSEWEFIAQKSQKWVESRLSPKQFGEWCSAAESLIKSL